MYDIIGDIHGYNNSLEALLVKLGYDKHAGYYKHPERKAIFCGDIIDRGPGIRQTLQLVKSMCDNNSAYMITGNHEYNAILFNTKSPKGRWLRKRIPKNIKQFSQTLAAFEKNPQELEIYIDWFRTLPIFLEFDNFRVIHACWDYELIEFLKKELPQSKFTYEFILRAATKNTPEYNAIEDLIKGKEIKLPKGLSYFDKDGNIRHRIRFQWWRILCNETYRSIAVNYEKQVPDQAVNQRFIKNHIPYRADDIPVFFGHYWRRGEPKLISQNVCCLDFSIAKRERLAAYRFDGERTLSNSKFVFTECVD